MPEHPARPPAGTLVCALAELVDGGGRLFSFPGEGGEFRLLVLRSGERCLGYENRCPHFQLPLAARDAHLVIQPHESVSCNVHYARFRWEDGHCEAGECVGESLSPVPLAVVDGEVRFA